MSKLMRRASILALLGVLVLPTAASAHSWLAGANPAPEAVLRRGPERIQLAFTTSLEARRSKVWLERSKGGRALAQGGVVPGRSFELTVVPPTLDRGVYRILYDASSIDGHEVRGAYLFAIWPSGTAQPSGIEQLSDQTAAAASGGATDGARAIAVIATVALAGLLLAPAWVRRPLSRCARRTASGLAVAALVADAVLLATSSPATTVGRWTIAHALLTLPAIGSLHPARHGTIGNTLRMALGGALIVPIAATGHGGSIASVAILAIHLIAAATWVGGVLNLALDGRDRIIDDARRFTPVAATSVAAVVVTGIVTGRIEIPSVVSLSTTAYGRALLVKSALVLATLGVGAWSYRRARSGVAPHARTELAAFGAVFAAASVLSALPTPPPVAPASRIPLVRTGVLAGGVVNVLVAPYRPGRNVVHVWAPGAKRTLAARLDGRPITLSSAGTASVTLPPGLSELRLHAGRARWSVPLDVRPTEAAKLVTTAISLDGDGADICRDRLLGEMAAVARRPDTALDVRFTDHATCDPARASDVHDAGAAFGRFFAARGAKHPIVLLDNSARSRAFWSGVRDAVSDARAVEDVGAARAAHGDVLMVATGVDRAKRAVDAARSDETWVPARGIALAPWLLEPAILEPASGKTPGPQLTIGLLTDPFSASANGYLTAIDQIAPATRPTGAGLEGYVEAQREMGAGRSRVQKSRAVQFFTPALWQILPTSVGGTHGTHLWLENGGLATISGAVPL